MAFTRRLVIFMASSKVTKEVYKQKVLGKATVVVIIDIYGDVKPVELAG